MVNKDGKPYVERVFVPDCGVVVNPDAAANMVQGAVVDGIGQSFYGALTHKNGAAEQSNFHNYRMIKHNEAPKRIEVHFVESEIDPTGLGEPPSHLYLGQWPTHCLKLRAKGTTISQVCYRSSEFLIKKMFTKAS
ncbi:MAG: molybdopterin cofactor-binding domain-containing protein [Spirosomataceae bacterium]